MNTINYEIENGYVKLPEATFNAMREELEDLRDHVALERALENIEEFFPGDLIASILNGDNAVRAFRKFRGMTQTQLAEAAGISQAMIVKIENGADGSVSTIKNIAAALDVDIDHLV